jgi:hypothetical protein
LLPIYVNIKHSLWLNIMIILNTYSNALPLAETINLMKKAKQKSGVKSVKKLAVKAIQLRLISALKAVTGQLAPESGKLAKKIEKGSKKLAKKISKQVAPQKSAKAEVAPKVKVAVAEKPAEKAKTAAVKPLVAQPAKPKTAPKKSAVSVKDEKK